MSFLTEYHSGIDARAESIADEMAPEIAKIAGDAIDLWFNEHTTLSFKEYDDLWRPALNAATLRHLGRKLEQLGDGHEAVLFTTLKSLYKEGT